MPESYITDKVWLGSLNNFQRKMKNLKLNVTAEKPNWGHQSCWSLNMQAPIYWLWRSKLWVQRADYIYESVVRVEVRAGHNTTNNTLSLSLTFKPSDQENRLLLHCRSEATVTFMRRCKLPTLFEVFLVMCFGSFHTSTLSSSFLFCSLFRFRKNSLPGNRAPVNPLILTSFIPFKEQNTVMAQVGEMRLNRHASGSMTTLPSIPFIHLFYHLGFVISGWLALQTITDCSNYDLSVLSGSEFDSVPHSTYPRCQAPSYSSRHHFSHIVYISVCQKTLQVQAALQPWAELSREYRSVYFLAGQMGWESEDICRLKALWLMGQGTQEGSQTLSWYNTAVWQIALH